MPSNLEVSIASDLPQEKVVALTRKHLEGLSPSSTSERHTGTPPQPLAVRALPLPGGINATLLLL